VKLESSDTHVFHETKDVASSNILQEDEDEEIQSYFCNESEKSLPDDVVDMVADKLQIADTAVASANGSKTRRNSHRRSVKSHNRSESLPIAPKVPPFDSVRHDTTRHFAQSPLYKFAKIRIKQDPLLSPLHASDELLSQMPPTSLVVSHSFYLSAF